MSSKIESGCSGLDALHEADAPERAADIIADNFLKGLKSFRSDGMDFWNNSNRNLLSLVLLYVTRAKGFVPLTDCTASERTGAAESTRIFEECRAYIGNPEALSENVQAAIGKYPEDEKLLKDRYTTWAASKEARQIALSLAAAISE